MPIQHAIWKVGDKPEPLTSSQLASEQKLEEMILRDPRILSSEWMLIGRQEVTSHGGIGEPVETQLTASRATAAKLMEAVVADLIAQN